MAVSASPRLWTVSPRSATEPDIHTTMACAAAVMPRMVIEIHRVRMPSRDVVSLVNRFAGVMTVWHEGMLDPVQSTRMGVVRLTDLMRVVIMTATMVAIIVFGTMFGTEVPT
jgi:hypothetical protein